MWAGKKAAGKKNKFEMEKGLVFNKSFDLVLSLKNFNFCNLAGSIAYNEKVFAKNVEFRRNSSSSKTFEWIEKQNLN